MNINSTLISISVQKEDPVLSRAQRQFNKLIKDIDKERTKLVSWKNIIPKYQQKYLSELCPRLDVMEKLKVKAVKLLDKKYTNGRLNKSEKLKVSSIICSLIDDLMDPNDTNNLKEIYNKHKESDFDQDLAHEAQVFKDMVSDRFGVDLGDDFKIDSPEEVMAKILNKMNQETEQEIKSKKSVRKKSTRTLAREKRLKEEAMEISQSIRDVHRKLAIRLHPDRELDPAEGKRKTLLMQRVNEAYNNKDLLQLLELQLEIEQLDQESLRSMKSERLKTYNKILREQLNSIRQEIDSVQVGFRMRFNFLPGERVSIPHLLKNLQCDIDDLRDEIASLTNDLAFFKEFKSLKKWLRGYNNPVETAFDDIFADGVNAHFF